MQPWNFTQPTAEFCRTALDLTWSRQQQHMLMEMVYGTTTVASCHLVRGQQVTLCEFLRYDLPPSILCLKTSNIIICPQRSNTGSQITNLPLYYD